MCQKAVSISINRTDGKLGVEFDSPKTLNAFLDFILAIDKPELRHFVPVLENGGILPQDDPDFENYLKKMGITLWTIPGDMRAYFLVNFQGGANMQMILWEKLPSDRRSDFIAYLKKASQIENLPSAMLEDRKRLKELVVPILEQGEGWIPEDLDNVRNLAMCWKITNYQLVNLIIRLWERMNEPLSAAKAGRIVKRSAGTMRRWARQGRIHADVDKKGHWTFTREVLIDHIS